MKRIALACLCVCVVLAARAQTSGGITSNAPERDIKVEDLLAAKFFRLHQGEKLPAYERLSGANFAKAACKAASEDKDEEQRVENSYKIAYIYSAKEPESSNLLSYLATRKWKHTRFFVVGVCYAQTSKHPDGQYWVAIGLVGNRLDQFFSELTGG